MNSPTRIILVGLVLLAFAGGAAALYTHPEWIRWGPERPMGQRPMGQAPRDSKLLSRPTNPTTPKPAESLPFDVDLGRFEDGGYEVAMKHSPPLKDQASLQDLRDSVKARGPKAIETIKANLAQFQADSFPTKEQRLKKISLLDSLGSVFMYEGEFAEAAKTFEQALGEAKSPEIATAIRLRLLALLGIVSLRQGEVENCIKCVGPSSCIFPIATEAVHTQQDGSRAAMKWFSEYLAEAPRDLRIIWLLNIAAMTLNDVKGLPSQFVLPVDRLQKGGPMGRFENVATTVGLTAHGSNLAGGSIFDDLNGDGLPDLVSTSLQGDQGPSLYLNRGDGTFEDRASSAGLDEQIYALNVTRADYDNDGDLDLLLLRGGWEQPLRLSLLRNRGDGTFEDVTIAAGMGQPIQCESAAWGDYDNDGRLDVFVCGEYLAPGAKNLTQPGDPRNRCRLYHNEGDGKFRDVAAEAGLLNERCAKGSAWGDYDGDGRLDLFVSNMGQPCRLYRNEGEGKFRDVAPELGVTGPDMSFACWFWDYDNDGKLDLYVNDYRARVAEVLLSAMGTKIPNSSRPRLYRNLGDGFRDVSAEVGLDRAMAPMGVNFGDIDNDGFLDLYLGTGDMSYEGLDFNLMFHNKEGRRFEDVTAAAGTGHLQKGHGVSFADYDGDGDLDAFIELGGATPGDKGYNALFRNPLQGRHWLKIKLVGTQSNRSAIGASLKVDVASHNGQTRSIYRTIGNNSSFGGNSLTEFVGLMDDAKADILTVTWPTSKTTQTFRDVAADQTIEITEGSSEIKVITPQAAVSK